MLYECLKLWRIRNIMQVSNTRIVLHTSCVNYKMDDLKNMFSLEFKFIIPQDVYYELRLLAKSKIFGLKANYILQNVQSQATSNIWDLSQVYKNCKNPILYSDIYGGNLIFIFGDLNKIDEFLNHSSRGNNIYILLPPVTWSCISGNCVIMELNTAQKYRLRKVKPLVPGRTIDKLQKSNCVYKNRKKDFPIPGYLFQSTGKCGSNAYIYTCPQLPGLLIKGYKKLSMIESQKEKLQLLQKFGSRVPDLNCAFPVDLLYDYPSSIVGYSMKPIVGKLLREHLIIGWDGHDLGKVFENLLLIILELHTMHIHVNDLSFNNVLIDTNDNVGFVDCDSFQITNYPGGGITKIYQHPEISDAEFSTKLREPRHEYFALAILLFQCIFGDEPLRQVQFASDDTELNWNTATFPLQIDDYSSKSNKSIQAIWFKQPRELRKAFFDEFTFMQDISIGSWVHILGIIN